MKSPKAGKSRPWENKPALPTRQAGLSVNK